MMDCGVGRNARVTKPWVEKYRPKGLEDVVHQKSAVSMLRAALQSQSLPHMLFYGPPGTGKTTVALIIARRLFGSAIGDRVLELNASDDRGIDVVRHKIKAHAARDVQASSTAPAFRLIILDEADCMTAVGHIIIISHTNPLSAAQDAQKALLRTMEVYSSHTRFIVICNYVSRLIGPLVSRCARIRFQTLPDKAMSERIVCICDAEDLQLEGDSMNALIRVSGGDLRRAIMLLQSAVNFGGPQIQLATILDVAGFIPNNVIDNFEAFSKTGMINSHTAIVEAIRNGYSARQLLMQFSDRLLHSKEYDQVQKAEIFEAMAEVDGNLSEGASEVFQLLLVGSTIKKTVHDHMEF